MSPLVILPVVIEYSSGVGWSAEPMYFFLFGAYNPPGGAEPSGWISGLNYLQVIMMLLLFFIIYAAQVTIYVRTPTTKRWAIVSGIVSLLIPYFFAGIIFSTPIEVLLGAGGVYVGPVPIQFVVGLLVMRISEKERVESVDDFLETDSSWVS
jgi:hypothetical protein